jgi:acyl-CoA reductase-like NAD-dependent aldehyde dehydrogenase
MRHTRQQLAEIYRCTRADIDDAIRSAGYTGDSFDENQCILIDEFVKMIQKNMQTKEPDKWISKAMPKEVAQRLIDERDKICEDNADLLRLNGEQLKEIASLKETIKIYENLYL